MSFKGGLKTISNPLMTPGVTGAKSEKQPPDQIYASRRNNSGNAAYWGLRGLRVLYKYKRGARWLICRGLFLKFNPRIVSSPLHNAYGSD